MEDRTQTRKLLSPHLLGTIAEIELRFFADNGPGENDRDGAPLHSQRARRSHCDRRNEEAGALGTKRKTLETGALSEADYKAIRERWDDVAPKTWIGQT